MSASQEDLKKIALIRIKSAKTLLSKKDWNGAGYLMGLALECALKSSICKTLRILNYPEAHTDKKVPDFFMTHSFDRLLLLSGLSDLFSPTGNALAFNNWSTFTIQYPAEWTFLRYTMDYFDEKKAKELFNCLMLDDNSIIKTIRQKRRW